MNKIVNKGDYVLAMSFSDGSCFDPWEIGFYADYCGGKHYLTTQHRGYFRVQRISKEKGELLLRGIPVIERCGKSLLFWVRNTKLLKDMIEKGEKKMEIKNKIKVIIRYDDPTKKDEIFAVSYGSELHWREVDKLMEEFPSDAYIDSQEVIEVIYDFTGVN